MSHHVVSEVYKRQVGKMQRKAVLALMADKASDDGRGIWASKQTLADELGCTKQTILSIIESLVVDGLLVIVGEQQCANGYTVEYRVDIEVLEALPLVGCHARKQSKKQTGQNSRPVKTLDPTSQNSRPHQSKLLTQTIQEPLSNLTPLTPRAGGRRAGTAISDDWELPRIADLPPKATACAEQWPEQAYEAEGEAFHRHWLGRGHKRADWISLWAARVLERHDAVMRAAKSGLSFGSASSETCKNISQVRPACRPSPAKRREDDRSAATHEALREIVGQAVWERWFAPAAILFTDPGLTIMAASQFQRERIETEFLSAIDQALGALGWAQDWVRVDVAAPGTRKTGVCVA